MLLQRMFLRKQLYRMEKGDNTTMATHVNDIRSLIDQLSGVGRYKFCEEEVVFILLSSMPMVYEQCVSSIANQPNLTTIKSVASSLILEKGNEWWQAKHQHQHLLQALWVTRLLSWIWRTRTPSLQGLATIVRRMGILWRTIRRRRKTRRTTITKMMTTKAPPNIKLIFMMKTNFLKSSCTCVVYER